jgi:hypothetical protein
VGDRVDQRGGLLPSDLANNNIHNLIEIANGLSNWFLEGQRAQPMSEVSVKTKRSAQRQQVAARQKLFVIHRDQARQIEKGERDEIDRELLQWITMCLRRIAANVDPVVAMAEFLGRKRKRGKREKNTDRHFEIAVAVAKKMMLSGLSLEKAVFAVAEDMGEAALSFGWIEAIYKKYRRWARAHVAMSCLTAACDAASPASSGLVPAPRRQWDPVLQEWLLIGDE